jgi:hypothetical protein
MLIEAVPVTGFAANFSPMPLIAPPPFGRATAGGEKRWSPPLVLFDGGGD